MGKSAKDKASELPKEPFHLPSEADKGK